MRLGRQTFKHTAIYSMAHVLGGMASFLMLPFYANYFQAEGYGVMAMIDTSLGIFTVLLAGGFQSAILRIYHEREGIKKELVLGTGIRLVWGLASLIVVLPLVFSAPLSSILFGNSNYYPLICLALGTFIIDVSGLSASTIQIIRQQSFLFSCIGLARLILGLSLNIWLVVILQIGLIGVFLSSFATAVASSLAFHVVAAKEHGIGFDRQIAVQLLRFQLPLLPGEIIAFLGRQTERILVRALVGLEGMGVLEMAYKFPPLLNVLINVPFQRAWHTKSVEIAEQEDAPHVIGAMFSRYLFMMVFAGLMLAVTIRSILELMTPPEFWQATRITQIEIITTIMTGCASYLSFGILYRKKTKILSLIKMALTPVKILLGFLLISKWGLTGAAFSALIIEAASLVWIGLKAQALYALSLEYGKIGVILACAFGLFLLLNGNSYSSFAPVAYAGEHWFSPLLSFLQSTPLGEWKSGKLIQILQSRQNQVTSLILNAVFSLSFLILLPLVVRTDIKVTAISGRM